MNKLTIALMGCGGRGKAYTDFAISNPDKFQVVAIADPDASKIEYFKEKHNIPDEMCFKSWDEMLARPKLADIAMICTQDQMHFEPAMAAIEKKYDLILEKPAAPTPEECMRIANAANKAGVKVVVCHVLRYTTFYKYIKQFIDDGKLGEIMNIMHIEGVGNTHQAHSYVRGNWRNLEVSTPMILAKSCHDVDLMQWFIGEECTKVQSFGKLSHFVKQNAPEGAPDYCLDGCPYKDTCYYYGPRAYEGSWFKVIVANNFEPTDEDVIEALKRGPYGRCVYKCDNDVVDHQVVNMQFGTDKYVTFTMSAFTKGGRVTKIMGTKGELTAEMSERTIKFYDFATCKTEVLMSPDKNFDDSISGGHGGGDEGIMRDVYEYLANTNPSNSITDISVSCKNHLIAFAAEQSRLDNVVIDMHEYEQQHC